MKAIPKPDLKAIRLALLATVAIASVDLHAQMTAEPFSYNADITPSVDTWKMTQHGSLKPSLYTGTMSYSLPLYTYSDEDFSIPMSLEYSYSGFRPAVHSGAVALGWTLNCGGAITREVRGLPDEMTGASQEADMNGYWQTVRDGVLTEGGCTVITGKITNRERVETPAMDPYNFDLFTDEPYMERPNGSRYDLCPDLFHFNFLGNTGEFMIGTDGKIHVFNTSGPFGEYSVEANMYKYDRLQTPEFTITTGEGYKYIFGGTLTSIEYNTTESESPNNVTISAWRLRRIESPNGNQVDFVFDSVHQRDISVLKAYSPVIEGVSLDSFQYQTSGATGFSSSATERFYFYDYMGRVIQIVVKYPDGSKSVHSTKYDFTGNALTTVESHAIGGVTDSFECRYTYDDRGRVKTLGRIVCGVTLPSIAYSYDDLGRLASREASGRGGDSYGYNLQGWQENLLIEMYEQEVFSQSLSYYAPSGSDAVPNYSGKVSESVSSHRNRTARSEWYGYDHLGRLTGNSSSQGSVRNLNIETGIRYSDNGNITALRRVTNNEDKSLTFTHYGNRLVSMTGGTVSMFAYDSDGRLVSDSGRNLSLSYNALGLTDKVTSGGVDLARYSYLSDGTKVKTIMSDGRALEYRGGFVYSVSADGSRALESIASPVGRIVAWGSDSGRTFRDLWFVRDRLGSVRAVVDITDEDADVDSAVLEESDYMPFGTRFTDSTAAPTDTDNRYRFADKEEQAFASLPYIDFGARLYDPVTARWNTSDPMAEKYHRSSPYAYCLGNPVNNVDPDGNVVWFIPLVKGLAGAAIDAGAQITVSMAMGKNFKESIKELDLTSIGASFVSSALLSPGLSSATKATKGAKVAAVGLNVANAAVDYTYKDGVTFVLGDNSYNKDIKNVVTDMLFSTASDFVSSKTLSAFGADVDRMMSPSYLSPLTKDQKEYVRQMNKLVKGDLFPAINNAPTSYFFSAGDNMFVVFMLEPEENNVQEDN